MFIPTKLKYKKQQKGKSFNKINSKLFNKFENFNTVFLKALECGHLNSNHFKTLKLSINRLLKKNGRLTFRIFPHTPVSKKPIEVRMGKGKGAVDHWVAKIKTGTILCKIETNSKIGAKKALLNVQSKLPIKTKII